MKTGTKSILFGVHQFIWHPITVARAWRFLYRRKPSLDELICIWVHDLGYWGCPNMDGEEGKRHPARGASIAEKLVYWRHRYVLRHSNGFSRYQAAKAYLRCALHSSSYAKLHNEKVSDLYLPDKVSILCEPGWFYRLRARLSGEGDEFVANSPRAGRSLFEWYSWYVSHVMHKVTTWFSEKQ